MYLVRRISPAGKELSAVECKTVDECLEVVEFHHEPRWTILLLEEDGRPLARWTVGAKGKLTKLRYSPSRAHRNGKTPREVLRQLSRQQLQEEIRRLSKKADALPLADRKAEPPHYHTPEKLDVILAEMSLYEEELERRAWQAVRER